MDYNFCSISREQALQDFNIDHLNYIDPIETVDDYMTTLRTEYSLLIKKQDYKKVVSILEEQKNKFHRILENPKGLSYENKQHIYIIRCYFNKNQGRLNGYYSFRKEKIDQVIQSYKQQEIQNRNIIIANKDEIELLFNDLINTYKVKQDEKNQETIIIRKLNKQDWHITYITCVCGAIIQQGCKARHEKTDAHRQFVNRPDDIPDTRNKWHLIKFNCSCGKIVTNGNKSAHEKTKYHLTHKKDISKTDSENIS